MAEPVNFPESNKLLSSPNGPEDDTVSPLRVWTDGRQCISRWKFTPEELQTLQETGGAFFVNVLYAGGTQPPIYVAAGPMSKVVF